jgi:SpoVK/Ycf46/Vps4 family AAA+-type ATPase
MTTSSKRTVVPAKKSSPLRKSKPVAKAKAKAVAGQRLLLSGQSRAELRTLGVALAAEADRDLYCVDLSRVAGKYIGETEKNLARVFAVAEATGAVLFFDEAEALFGKRTPVKDSHDRHANQAVSYLLERIEAYPGLVVLTTNNRKNLDEAFLRRLRFTRVEQVPARRKSA